MYVTLGSKLYGQTFMSFNYFYKGKQLLRLPVCFPGNEAHLKLGVILMGRIQFPQINPIALKKAKIVYNFGLPECNRVKKGGKYENRRVASPGLQVCLFILKKLITELSSNNLHIIQNEILPQL